MASAFRLAFFLCLTGVLISETWSCRRACPKGWATHGCRCFRFVRYRRTMAHAELTCVALGGNLASIHSSWEHFFIQRLIRRSLGRFRRFRRFRRSPKTWIGLNDAIQERKWMWTDGSKVDYTRWSRSQPNNLINQDCTEMNFGGRFWNDISCLTKNPFVCARKR